MNEDQKRAILDADAGRTKVMRYDCSMAYGAPVMDEEPDYGDWVRYEDYARLAAELEEEKAAHIRTTAQLMALARQT